MARDRCVFTAELPMSEILMDTVRKGPSVLLPFVTFVGEVALKEYFIHPTYGLQTSYTCWASCLPGTPDFPKDNVDTSHNTICSFINIDIV